MTGMGEDGVAGMGAVQSAGGSTIAQSPETCVVDSMPRIAIERGFAQRVVNMPNLASILQTKCVPDQPSSRSTFRFHTNRNYAAEFWVPKEIVMKQFEASHANNDRQPVRYLVVDDSVFARKSLARWSSPIGGEVVGEAGDGCTAITEYARTMPDIVLMDITMPQMEGIEAVERIVPNIPTRAS